MNSTELRERYDVSRLAPPGGIGIELGVAQGVFSEQVLLRSQLSYLYSVDMYAGDRGHGDEQYREALLRLMPHRARNCVLRMRFDQAVLLFPDHAFDFVYVDGYAHTGQESGRTLQQWYPKVRPGGIFAGDDYSDVWPLTKSAVDQFARQHRLALNVITPPPDPDSAWSEQPTWWCVKPG